MNAADWSSRRVSPTYAALATQLRQERERQGLTQRELGRRIEEYSTALCNWENGRSVPGIAAMEKWAAGLGLKLMLMPVKQEAPLTDAQLAEIRQHNGEYGLGDATDIITDLLGYVDWLRSERQALRPEYGVRVTYADGRDYEAVLGDDADYVRGQIAAFDARNRGGAATREPLQREVSGWRKWDVDGER